VAAIELTAGQFEERRRWAARHGHAYYLWPEVPTESFHAARGEVARVTAAILVGRADVRLERPHYPVDAWPDALTVAAFTTGLGPLLGWWQETGALDSDPQVRALLAQQLEHSRARAARMGRALLNTASLLHSAGLGLGLLKGSHTAHYCFPDPATRPMTDHDVLVDAGDVLHAESALREAGYTLVAGSRVARPYRSTWRPPGAPSTVRSIRVHHPDNPFTVDLHTSLDLNFVGVRTLRWPQTKGWQAAPWAGSRSFVLPQPLLVAHLAAHASLTLQNLTLLRITELVLLLQRDAEREFGWRDLGELLQQAQAERFVFPAFELVERFVPGTVDPELRQRLARAATPALRNVVNGLTAATAQRSHMAVDEMFMWGVSPFDYVRRAAYTLLPPEARSPRLLRGLYMNRVVRLLRGGVALRG
jgi:hypothetical protein